MRHRKPKSFVVPGGVRVAVVLKSGSSSIAKAIIDTHYPELSEAQMPISYPADGLQGNRPGWQGVCPKTEEPATIVPVRDPVERFRSALAQIGRQDVDVVLDELEDGGAVNPHLFSTSRHVVETCALYRFPEHVAELAVALGVPELENINESLTHNGPKPDLTPEQLARVQAIYAEDIELYESITEAGQDFITLLPDPEPEPLPARLKQKMSEQPATVRATFAPAWAGVKVLLDEGDVEAAQVLIVATDVPPELEAAKVDLLAEFVK